MKSFSLFCAFLLVLHPLGVADFTPIPLSSAANMGFTDEVAGDGKGGWTDQGRENSPIGFPRGNVEFAGIPFVIPEEDPAVVLFQNRQVARRPASIKLAVDSVPARQIYLLSACAWQFTKGEEVARLRVRHADGSVQEEPLLYGDHTGQWWTPSTGDHSAVVWRAETEVGVPIGVYLTSFTLSDAADPVEEIEISVRRGSGAFLLLGITLSNEEQPSLVIPNVWVEEKTGAAADWFSVSPAADTGAESAWAKSVPQPSRQLVAELSDALPSLSADEQQKVIRILGLLGYTGARLPSLERLLAPRDKAISKGINEEAALSLETLLKTMTEAGLSFSFRVGGGREYGIDDGVAAFRDVNTLRFDHYFLDPAARELMLDTFSSARESALGENFAAARSASILGEATLLSDNQDVLTAPHFAMLQNAWCSWLLERHGNDEKLLAAWQVADADTPLLAGETLHRARVGLLSVNDRNVHQLRWRERFADQLLFLEEFQQSWLAGVAESVRSSLPDLKLAGATWFGPDHMYDFHTRSMLGLDRSEELIGNSLIRSGMRGPALFRNVSSLGFAAPFYYRTAFNRVAGRPFAAWDNASAWPGEFEFTRLLLTMVLGARQGWQEIMHRQLDRPVVPDLMRSMEPALDLLQNPAFLAVLPLGRHLFLRGDLETGPMVFERTLFNAEAHRQGILTELDPGMQPLLFLGGVAAKPVGEPEISDVARTFLENPAQPIVTSSSGDLVLNREADQLLVQTPLSVALVGSLSGSCETDAVAFETQPAYGVVYATSLDGKALGQSESLLLGVVGKTANSGEKIERSLEPVGFFSTAWRILEPGTAPVLMQPVEAKMRIQVPKDGRWVLTPLNSFGQPLGSEPVILQSTEGHVELTLDNRSSSTPLYHLSYEE